MQHKPTTIEQMAEQIWPAYPPSVWQAIHQFLESLAWTMLLYGSIAQIIRHM